MFHKFQMFILGNMSLPFLCSFWMVSCISSLSTLIYSSAFIILLIPSFIFSVLLCFSDWWLVVAFVVYFCFGAMPEMLRAYSLCSSQRSLLMELRGPYDIPGIKHRLIDIDKGNQLAILSLWPWDGWFMIADFLTFSLIIEIFCIVFLNPLNSLV